MRKLIPRAASSSCGELTPRSAQIPSTRSTPRFASSDRNVENGARTIVLARFVPVVRTFATVMAGVARMDFRRFALYSLVGGVAWTTSVTLLGYWLGQVALVRDHVELFIVGVVVLSLVPVALEARRSRRASRRES